MAYVNRDPFARAETHRDRVYVQTQTCDWCGQAPATKTGRRYLYTYRVEQDSGRVDRIQGEFCSLACMHSYHD